MESFQLSLSSGGEHRGCAFGSAANVNQTDVRWNDAKVQVPTRVCGTFILITRTNNVWPIHNIIISRSVSLYILILYVKFVKQTSYVRDHHRRSLHFAQELKWWNIQFGGHQTLLYYLFTCTNQTRICCNDQFWDVNKN